MKKKKPPKIDNLLDIIRKCIEEDRYTVTTHAFIRQQERKINFSEVVHILKTGYEEKKKSCFDENNNVWKYAIRGKTKIDELDVRIIVTIDANGVLIITVMYVENL